MSIPQSLLALSLGPSSQLTYNDIILYIKKVDYWKVKGDKTIIIESLLDDWKIKSLSRNNYAMLPNEEQFGMYIINNYYYLYA